MPRSLIDQFCLLLALSGIVVWSPAAEIGHQAVAVDAPFPMTSLRVPIFPPVDFPISAYGAPAEGDITASIATAIAACHDAGGGRVVIPAGNWSTTRIRFPSKVHLYLAKGATLTFAGEPADYLPAVRSSWEGYECFNYAPLIYAFQCEDVALTGEGTLVADLRIWNTWMGRPPAHMEALKKLYTMASTLVPVEQRQMAEGENHLRPQFIQFNRCRNVLIEGLTIRNSPFWTTHLLLCDSVVVRKLDISAQGHNNDGIDPEMTRNLLVEDCTFDQGDDAIAIKSGCGIDAWNLNTPTENVDIRNCTVKKGFQLVAIGSELSGGVRNVFVQHCRLVNEESPPRNLLFIKTNLRRGGFVENIHMADIEAPVIKASVLGIETDVFYQWRTLVPTYEERRTRISGIHIRDVKVGKTGGIPFRILGDVQQPVTQVVLENIAIGKATGAKNRYENASGIEERNVQIGEILPAEKAKN